mgnify:CR=1 FL=1
MTALSQTGCDKYEFEYVDELPIDVIPITLYKNWEFEGYFIDLDGYIWFYNGEQYRQLRVDNDNKVRLWDINHKLHNISIHKLLCKFI